MSGVSWESVIAVLGLAVPVAAALWEFFLAGRKRLGYRVQMDTSARDSASSSGPEAGVLQRMQWDGAHLGDPSVVLLRIENVGWTPIVEDDYVAPANDPVGIRVAFPGRRVVGMVVTECSHTVLRDFFAPGTPGLGSTDGVITLPKVKLNRRAHYKVLAVLDRVPGFTDADFPDPEVTAGVVGGVRGGTIKKTEYYPFASRPVRWLLAVLVLVSAAQSVSAFARDDAVRAAAPLDCAKGTLYLSGSTAFRPVLEAAAKQYTKTCTDAEIPLTGDSFQGSVAGLDTLAAAGEKAKAADGQGLGNRLSFSDGPKSDGRPQLLPRPVALSLFTLVVNKDAGVRDLSLDQVRRIYAGDITNWKQVRGNDLPVQLVSRNPGSGTRTTLQQQVLDGEPLLAVTASDCRSLDAKTPGRCEVADTPTLLDTVASTPGALGHSEVGAATAHEDVQLVRIDGYPATLEGADEGAYPYWQTEIAYTYGEPPADSIAAGFLRYLANEVGKDILRSRGHRPCAELDEPLLCRPSGS
ncbi:substrate-binding domain-containing protein [Streptomyces sp. TRM S81-3]|uniref:Substrate-binding domain-containing protein n=1 Tax=Streptomyces griseicoloratus TaxID=2752516 RepID=A0A926KVM5_9ACTN|nr:substrate-binding domain-containing protein [Streptomyces griseicoloratus]MBD0417677.1 substrate-binding domain-containing protein [Streptomyces griseicoloratus]